MECRDVIARLSEYLDQEVVVELREELEVHLVDCPECRIHVETVKKTIALYRTERDRRCPEQVRSRLHALLSVEYRKK